MSHWVIDANLAVNTVLNNSDTIIKFWEQVEERDITPCAPRLWMSETTSAVRFYLKQKVITNEEALQAIKTIHRLQIETIDEDESICLRALELADLLDQNKAYDAFYLATAENLDAATWTADERLANRCRNDLKLEWVHWIGELT